MQLVRNAGATLVVALLATPLLAQDPYVRPKKQIDTTTVGIGLQPSVSSEGSLTAVVYFDGGTTGTQNVHAVVGLGEGEFWLPPVRVDDDTTGADKLTQFDSCIVAGGTIYAVWRDERNGSSNEDLYFARSSGGTVFEPDVQLDVGPATGTGGRVRAWRTAVSPDPAPGDHVYVAAVTDTPAEPNDELWLTASHDGGATFAPAVRVPRTAAPHQVESVAIAADGLTVHVLWSDDRSDPAPGGSTALDDVWYQRSTDGGVTWLPADVRLDSSGPGVGDAAATTATGFAIRSAGGVLAAAWLEELTDPTDEEVRVAVSTDGGTTWSPDVRVGGYDPLTDDVDTMDLWVAGNGNVCVAYDDDRASAGPDDHLYVSTSTDAGATWSEVEVSGPRGGNDPRFAGSGPYVGLCFAEDAGPNNAAVAADSRDFGVTWRASVALQDGATDADSTVAGWSSLYRNWIHAWLANDFGTNDVFVGGYRDQTLVPTVTPLGGGAVAFDFELRDFPAGDEVGFVALTATPGILSLFPLGDPRVLGVTPDELFALSLATPALVVPLLGGNGASPSIVASGLPPGASFHAAALSFDLGSGVDVGEVSDLVPVSVP